MIENPFIALQYQAQQVSWKHCPSNTIYQMELILPFRAIVDEAGFRDGGAYVSICAQVLEDRKLNVSEIQAGSFIIINFPIRTFSRAWLCISRTFREQFCADDNLKVTFRKGSKQDISIISYERVVPTDEQKEFAEKNYVVAEPSFKRKLVVRRSEEL